MKHQDSMRHIASVNANVIIIIIINNEKIRVTLGLYARTLKGHFT